MATKPVRKTASKTTPKKKSNVARAKNTLRSPFAFSKLQLSIVAGVLIAVALLVIVYVFAATPAEKEAESWAVSGGQVAIKDDASASSGKYLEFLAAPVATQRGPVSYSSLEEAKTALGAPTDANYVMWNTSWPKDRDLEDVFASLGSNDILVLPERPEPYIIDSSEGFRAAGVTSVTGRNGQLPIVNKYKGIRTARTWFAMARARQGILGM